MDNIPTAEISGDSGLVVDILVEIGLAKSKSEARRLIEGGGISVDGQKVSGVDASILDSQRNNGFVLTKGKKVKLKVTVKSNNKNYVLDLKTKKALNNTLMATAEVGYGTHRKKDINGQLFRSGTRKTY